MINIPEKQYFEKLAWVGVADKKTIMNVVYKNQETGQVWAKRFIVDKFILDKTLPLPRREDGTRAHLNRPGSHSRAAFCLSNYQKANSCSKRYPRERDHTPAESALPNKR